TERFRRLPLGEDVAVDPGWPTLHRAVAEAMQLNCRREHVVEARHVAVVHQVQIALERRAETRDTFIVEARPKGRRAVGVFPAKLDCRGGNGLDCGHGALCLRGGLLFRAGAPRATAKNSVDDEYFSSRLAA